jgi:hypothetical protein
MEDKNIYIKFSLGDYLRPGSHKVAMTVAELASHKVAVSLPELVTQTNQFSTKNRPGCNPTLQNSDPKDLFLKYNVKCHLKTSDPAGHEVKVHFDVSKVTPETKADNLDIRVSCSCPAFLYWGAQWNLHERDGLEGTPRPQLQAPTERLDLRSNFVICKHCKAVFERILPSVQHNIVKLVRQKNVDEYKKKHPGDQTPERLQREQEQMKKRLDLRDKRKEKNKDVEKDLLEGLRRREEERMKGQPSEQDEVIDRTEPATEENREDPEFPQKVVEDNPGMPPEEDSPEDTDEDEKPTSTDINQSLQDAALLEKKRLEDQRKQQFRDFVDRKMKQRRRRSSLQEEDDNE